MSVFDTEQLHLLHAMGVDVYVSRAAAASLAETFDAATAQTNARKAGSELTSEAQLVVVCAGGVRGDARLAKLFTQLPQILGLTAGSIAWLEADAGGDLPAAPAVPAYLVLGAAMARSLGVQLSTMQQNSAIIAVTDEPAQLPGSAMQKRALWQVLKPLARRLRVRAA